MSEYLSKKAVLEWLNKLVEKYQINERSNARSLIYGIHDGIFMGYFDADNSEVQRLRAAAIKLHETINSFWQGDCDKADVVAAQSNLCDALSTTTEPTGAERVREIYAEWVAERDKPYDPNYPIYGAIVENRIAQIEEIAHALGITIPGINAPEKGENA